MTAGLPKYLESSEVWCCRKRMETSWAECVRNEKVLHTFKEERNILYTITTREANWIGHI
jgi:hypothetical protein